MIGAYSSTAFRIFFQIENRAKKEGSIALYSHTLSRVVWSCRLAILQIEQAIGPPTYCILPILRVSDKKKSGKKSVEGGGVCVCVCVCVCMWWNQGQVFEVGPLHPATEPFVCVKVS
jgi:hypothetical protein